MAGITTKTEVRTGGLTVISHEQYSPLGGDNYKVSGLSSTASGADVTLPAWTVMGQISSSKEIVPLDPAAVDGSQYYYGILYLGLNSEVVILDGTTNSKLSVINKGKFDKNSLNFENGDLDSVVDGRTVFSWMNYAGMILEDGIEQTQLAE